MTDELANPTAMQKHISLETFHRHFLITHLKGDAACVLDRLEQRAHQSGESFGSVLEDLMSSCYSQPGFRDDKWYAAEVMLDQCYFAQDDFRYYPVPQNERFVDFLRDKRAQIESGSFPCSSEIRAPWSEMPEPLIQERELGKYYVIDGQLRVIRHWYHNVPKVKVYIYRGQLGV